MVTRLILSILDEQRGGCSQTTCSPFPQFSHFFRPWKVRMGFKDKRECEKEEEELKFIECHLCAG